MAKKKIIIFAAVFILLAGFSGWYIYRDFTKRPASNNLENQNPAIAGNATSTSGVDASGAKENQPQIAIPELNRPINIPANLNLSEDTKKLIQDKIAKLVADLKKEPNSFGFWLQLAIYRKMIDDYEGAKEIWEYTSKIMPNDSVSFNNLGDLYGYFLKDNKKAEENFLKALEKGPNQIYIYRSVYEFYRNVMKDDAKAKEILQKGIKLNPDTSKDLKYLLDNY